MEAILEKVPSRFPICERPYEEMALRMGLTEDEMIARLRELKEAGVIRRVAAVLFHRKVAYAHNAMVVWKVGADDVDRIGGIMASFDEVSHCYERDGGGYWDYNVYTMVHAKTHEECMDVIGRMSEQTGVTEYLVHFSKREFKKTSFSVTYE